MFKTIALSTVMALIVSNAAFAQVGGCTATVNNVVGSLLVNQGQGFVPLTHNIVLHPGDVVMASGSGAGKVVFSDGGAAKVFEGNAVRVPESMPCAGTPEGTEASNGIGPNLFLGGTAIAAGAGIIALIASSHSSKSSPVSP